MTAENPIASVPGSGPRISVIVPCYNSARTIARCLGSILGQRTSEPFDVTVVDSSTDETAAIVARDYPQVKLVRSEKRLIPGVARNLGVRSTTAPICLMIDSDCVAEPDLIERVAQHFREDDYAAVGGALRNGTPGSLSGLIGYLLEFKEFMPSTPLRLETSIATANLAYRREAFLRHGPFDEDMAMAEDLLLNRRVYDGGGRILFDPAIAVTHMNRTGWRRVLGYQVKLGWWSAKARRRGNLSGEVLLRHRTLIALLPLARTARAGRWLAAHSKRLLLLFLLIWPLYLLGAMFWAYGFYRGSSEEVRPSESVAMQS